MAGAFCLLLFGFLVHVLGVFTFYKDVVPYLAPILPKPEGAPPDAQSQFHWKGFGLSWHWERDLPSGCASWGAADERFLKVRFKPAPCSANEHVASFTSYNGRSVDLYSPMGARGSHCSVHTADVTADELRLTRKLLSEAAVAAKGEAEREMVAQSLEYLDQPEPGEGEHPCGEEYAERLRAVGKWP